MVEVSRMPATEEPSAVRCENCAAALVGRFCAACGQEATSLRRPLRQALGDLAGELWGYDTRLTRTLRVLLMQPGQASVDVVAGQRVAYVPPLRLYLFVSLVLFLAIRVFDVELLRVAKTTSNPGGTRVAAVATDNAAANVTPGAGTTEEEAKALAELGPLGAGIARALRDPVAFRQRLAEHLPTAIFLLVPLFAGCLQLLYWRRRFYVENLIFSLHLHSAAFLYFLPALLLDEALGTDLLRGLVSFGLVWYLYRALRRFHGAPRFPTLWRSIALTALHTTALGVAVIGLIILAALTG